jgi:hypothetical protein
MPVPLSVTVTLRIPSWLTSTVTSARLAPACLAMLDSASRSTASACSVSSSLFSVRSPAPSRSDGAKPSIAVISSTRRTMPARGSDGMSAASLACSAKMAPRISLMVSSMSSTARDTRSATSGLVIIGMVPCNDIPVAYSRWMTRSCRSRAIRSRSWYTDRRSASARLAASSSATPA